MVKIYENETTFLLVVQTVKTDFNLLLDSLEIDLF